MLYFWATENLKLQQINPRVTCSYTFSLLIHVVQIFQLDVGHTFRVYFKNHVLYVILRVVTKWKLLSVTHNLHNYRESKRVHLFRTINVPNNLGRKA
jgi:hypothetical protein